MMKIKDLRELIATLSNYPDDTPVRLIGNNCPGNYGIELLDSVIYPDEHTKEDVAVIWVNRIDTPF